MFLDKNILSVKEIQQQLKETYGIHFTISTIRGILSNSELFDRASTGKYMLSQEFLEKIKNVETESNERYKRVIKQLFGEEAKVDTYLSPFLEFLSKIFSKISEEYVKQLKGDTDDLDIVGEEYFNKTLENIIEEYQGDIDSKKFRRGIIKFFRYNDPDYDYIKWTIAQSYYLLKALGLDPKGHLLSESKFRKGTFYLDTNIIIAYVFICF